MQAQMTHPFLGVAQFAARVIQIIAAHVREFEPLQALPDALIRVTIMSIARWALQVDAFGGRANQQAIDSLTVMRG